MTDPSNLQKGYTNLSQIIQSAGQPTLQDLQATRAKLLTQLVEVQNEIAEIELYTLIYEATNPKEN